MRTLNMLLGAICASSWWGAFSTGASGEVFNGLLGLCFVTSFGVLANFISEQCNN